MSALRIGNALRREACPACGAAAIAKKGDLPVADSIPFSTHAIRLERVPELWACRACGSWFIQNAIPADSAKALYAEGSSGERWAAEPFARAKCPELLAEFDRHVAAGCRLLDVGCSNGLLLDYARDRGAVTCGTDYSSSAAQALRSRGHRFAAALDELRGERFDVITAFDVIEHVYDLPGFLSDVAGLLDAGGKLIVLTGDVGSIGAKTCGSRWWYVGYPEHIVFPSRRFFRRSPAGLHHVRTVRTYASVGYRHKLTRSLRVAASMALRGTYAGLPSIGPDHILVVMRHD